VRDLRSNCHLVNSLIDNGSYGEPYHLRGSRTSHWRGFPG
jgi:hypothetical protein